MWSEGFAPPPSPTAEKKKDGMIMKRTYTVAYCLFQFDKEREIQVEAQGKEDAYNVAVYGAIPQIEGTHPYSAWVKNAIQKNGGIHEFYTFEGKRF